MGFFVIVIRVPFGVVVGMILLLWTVVVAGLYAVAFVFLSLFGRLQQIRATLNPWFATFNGVKFLPGVWGWVFRPGRGIFEDNRHCAVAASHAAAGKVEISLVDQVRAAAVTQRNDEVASHVPESESQPQCGQV